MTDEASPEQRWSEVDLYVEGLLQPADPILEEALRRSEEAGLPPIQVAPNQGALLQFIARAQGARRILEIGTLGGYSTIWLARALPAGGRLVTLELEPTHAEVAAGNVSRAGFSDRVEIRIGPALSTLAAMVDGNEARFDLTFIDADKPSTTEYFQQALRLSRPGSLIVVDNVVRKGALVDAESEDPDVLGMRRFLEALSADTHVSSTVVQTVGTKGHDGFAVALVNEI
jgi:predicted O-methyltransferase YrrM